MPFQQLVCALVCNIKESGWKLTELGGGGGEGARGGKDVEFLW